jgi:hypothetical protein
MASAKVSRRRNISSVSLPKVAFVRAGEREQRS